MLGYYLKDSCESHFQFVENNVNALKKNASKLKHAKYSVVTLKNNAPLS
jgi:hypothetical protein